MRAQQTNRRIKKKSPNRNLKVQQNTEKLIKTKHKQTTIFEKQKLIKTTIASLSSYCNVFTIHQTAITHSKTFPFYSACPRRSPPPPRSAFYKLIFSFIYYTSHAQHEVRHAYNIRGLSAS